MAAKASHPLTRDFLNGHRLDWTDHHRRNAVSVLNRWHLWTCANGVDLVGATSEECTTYLGERAAAVGKSTLIKDHQFLKWFYAWCHAEGELEGRNPMARVKGPGQPPHDPRRTPHIAEHDFDTLMASFDKRKVLDCRNAAICSLMYRSGARRSEVARADLDRVDLDRACLEVIGKTGQWETIPLAAETCRLLERYLRRRGDDRSPALFVGTTATAAGDGRLDPRAISEMLARRGERLGLHLPPHAFRRAMAINAKDDGLNDTTVQHIGRWRDGRMVARYQRNAQAELATAEFNAKDRTARRVTAPRRRLRAV